MRPTFKQTASAPLSARQSSARSRKAQVERHRTQPTAAEPASKTAQHLCGRQRAKDVEILADAALARLRGLERAWLGAREGACGDACRFACVRVRV
eukprot:6187621-Pleurochrysis_carterae.AAC.1